MKVKALMNFLRFVVALLLIIMVANNSSVKVTAIPKPHCDKAKDCDEVCKHAPAICVSHICVCLKRDEYYAHTEKSKLNMN
ncbi:hypothetical protein P3S68_002184 [Capsicum galapagoense]